MPMITNFLLVAFGGAVGSVARYGIYLLCMRYALIQFPLATLLVNILGSFLIGVCAGWVEAGQIGFKALIPPLLMAGLCGGFTTFSAFSLETVNLLKQGAVLLATGYVAIMLLTCLLATAGGFVATR